MAEVIGVASGMAGLLSLTIEVIGISYEYIVEVQDASSAAQRFVSELEEIKIVLLKIDTMSKEDDDREIFGEEGSCFLSLKESNEYISLLESLREKLESRLAETSLRRKMKALTWPFSEEKTRTLIDLLHRHLGSFTTGLTLDNLYVS